MGKSLLLNLKVELQRTINWAERIANRGPKQTHDGNHNESYEHDNDRILDKPLPLFFDGE